MNGHQTLPGAFEFHVSKSARDYYRFDLSLFSLSGNVILADFEAARRFAEAINARRNPEQAVSPGQVNAMGLIDELLHLIVRQYLEAHPRAMQEALSALRRSLGPHAVEQALRTFAALFPPSGFTGVRSAWRTTCPIPPRAVRTARFCWKSS